MKTTKSGFCSRLFTAATAFWQRASCFRVYLRVVVAPVHVGELHEMEIALSAARLPVARAPGQSRSEHEAAEARQLHEIAPLVAFAVHFTPPV